VNKSLFLSFGKELFLFLCVEILARYMIIVVCLPECNRRLRSLNVVVGLLLDIVQLEVAVGNDIVIS
jgi:hypothetical protein